MSHSNNLKQASPPSNWVFRYRGVLPIIMLFFAFVSIQNHGEWPFLVAIGSYSNNNFWIILVAAFIGFFMRIITVGYTPKGTSGRNTVSQVAESLNTEGVYSSTRNPLYFGNLIIWLSLSAFTLSGLFLVIFIVLFIAMYRPIIKDEEAFLSRKFQDEYLNYRNRTPLFFPNIFLFNPSSRAFNWKKVLRKEKNGLAAICVLSSLFHLMWTLESVTFQAIANVWIFLVPGAIGVLSYLLIKILMLKTSYLNNNPSIISQ
ncbi:MAG: protein-S-isoprenylcysteine O-methyltransferase Ste14 [Marinoscillum sp.]|jgi:protein-S-isoprenylcysteine O-methyltransferase Ste14